MAEILIFIIFVTPILIIAPFVERYNDKKEKEFWENVYKKQFDKNSNL